MAACVQLLELYHIWNRRMNSGAAKIVNETTGKVRMFQANKKGTGDILATPRTLRVPCNDEFGESKQMLWLDGAPTVLWIECKASDGRQRPGQKDFQAEVQAAGHIYLLVNDVDQLRKWLKDNGVIR